MCLCATRASCGHTWTHRARTRTVYSYKSLASQCTMKLGVRHRIPEQTCLHDARTSPVCYSPAQHCDSLSCTRARACVHKQEAMLILLIVYHRNRSPRRLSRDNGGLLHARVLRELGQLQCSVDDRLQRVFRVLTISALVVRVLLDVHADCGARRACA